MKGRIGFIFIVLFLIHTSLTYSQRVGVVLSGGGAAGLAHVGLLKALEEAHIPIDYIVGSSAGALVGAMYASGMSPIDIEEYILSGAFEKLVSGKPAREERFFLRERSEDASMFRFSFRFDSLLYNSLPTNYLTPAFLDFEILRLIGVVGASKGNDFDSLFVPFRCVASDVYNKKSILFKDGDLNEAVRASMTFPFFVNPIRVDGKLLFDGGLYNNFPSDIMYSEFSSDYIIGSNVSGNDPPPKEEDIISQITTLFSHQSDYEIPCETGIMIEPQIDIGTFEFYRMREAINAGYNSTKKYIDSIRQFVHRIEDTQTINARRASFKTTIPAVYITEVNVQGVNAKDVSFVKDNFVRDSLRKPMPFHTFEKRYFRAYSTEQVKYIYPTLRKEKDSLYSLHLKVTKQKPFTISIGGHLSTRPINTGYIGLSYTDIGKGAIGVFGEAYFGKFYTSTKLKIDYDLPTLFPLRLSPYFVLNRWDFYENSTTFFATAKPSYVTQNEIYYGFSLEAANQRNGKYGIDFRKFKNKDQYYQVADFKDGDTSDITFFQGESVQLRYEFNTLNRKQFASEGALLRATLRYIQGKEISLSGSTIKTPYDIRRWHNWVNFSIEGQKYFNMASFFKIGIYGELNFSSNALFSNYMASILNTSDFSPIPDSKTIFMTEYRAPQFLGTGLDIVFNYRKSFEFRFSPYYFLPLRQIVSPNENTFGYSDLIGNGMMMASSSLIYHSPFGPLRLTANYFPMQKHPFIVQLSFGYIIFNKHSIR
ncbi:MAG: patatin-like phospholipase family protein [Brumimicrobium sp.]|nr:patatin-like phospholipase family protein [Brumimicrobium sp.]